MTTSPAATTARRTARTRPPGTREADGAPQRASEPPGRPEPPRTIAERGVLVASLDDARAWPAAAASLLAELGFRVVSPVGPDRRRWHLLIALRDQPTERHFDPEHVAYYAQAGNGAAVRTFDRRTPGAPGTVIARAALWGHVHVIDRVPVENRFLTFGGDLRMAAVDEHLTVVDLSSPAPVARWGGHSQGTDALSEAMGAFFGRLIVPINFTPGVAARIDALPPGVLYRAFLADGLRRAATAERHGAEHAGIAAWIAQAWVAARADADACDAAQRLLRDLRLD